MAPFKNIEELAQSINKHRHSKPPRILVAGDLYYRSHILSWTVQGHQLRTCLGWSKNWFRNFVSIGSNRTLWRNKKKAPKSFLALYELSRSRAEHLQSLFDRKLVTPETSGTQARILIAGHERSRPPDYTVDHKNSPRIPRTLRECPDYLSLGRTSLTRTEKRSLERTAAEIERLLKGTIDDFLDAAAECDRFERWHRPHVPWMLKRLQMSNSKFFKIARCVRIGINCPGHTRNLPRPLYPLYRISQIKLPDLREALKHEIFSRHTTAPQVSKILADFKAKKIPPKS